MQAVDAESAIALARSERPALVLMDLRLPGMDGLAATRQLKQDSLTGGIKIVAVTGLSDEGDAERALAAGCDAYLSKPISYDSFPWPSTSFCIRPESLPSSSLVLAGRASYKRQSAARTAAAARENSVSGSHGSGKECCGEAI